MQVYHIQTVAFWVERNKFCASWTDGFIPVPGLKACIDSSASVHHSNTKSNHHTSSLSSDPHQTYEHTHTSKKHTFLHRYLHCETMNSCPWTSPALSLNPWAWVIVRPSEIIVAFNANGSPAHSLFSPGNRVLQSVKGPMSYCSAWTTLRLRGKWQKPTAHSPPLSPIPLHLLCVPLPIYPRETGTTQRTWDCITAVAGSDGLVMGVLWRCGQNDRRSGLSCVTAALDHRQLWLVEKGFPSVTALLGLLWDLRGKQREECGRRGRGGGGDSEVHWPADNTWQETDRFDMWTCPHLCSREMDTESRAAAADWASIYSHSTLLKSNTHQTESQQCT